MLWPSLEVATAVLTLHFSRTAGSRSSALWCEDTFQSICTPPGRVICTHSGKPKVGRRTCIWLFPFIYLTSLITLCQQQTLGNFYFHVSTSSIVECWKLLPIRLQQLWQIKIAVVFTDSDCASPPFFFTFFFLCPDAREKIHKNIGIFLVSIFSLP